MREARDNREASRNSNLSATPLSDFFSSLRASRTCALVPYNPPDPFHAPNFISFRSLRIMAGSNGVDPPVASHGYCWIPAKTL